ncbi:MAG: hypothetical protein WAZ12_01030 [Candidatus Absconditicoccaceae bacterium]
MKKVGIITGIIAASVLAKHTSAIAETLNKNKKINQTEQTTNIQQQTNDELNLNLISPPDTIKYVKDIFYSTIVETAQEKIDADKMRNNAMNSPYRDVTKELITIVYSFYEDKDKLNLLLFTTLLLDPNHQYGLSQQAYDIVKKDKYRTMLFESLMGNFIESIENKKLEEEGKKLEEGNKKLEEEGKKLDAILKHLEGMTKIYEDYIRTHPPK